MILFAFSMIIFSSCSAKGEVFTPTPKPLPVPIFTAMSTNPPIPTETPVHPTSIPTLTPTPNPWGIYWEVNCEDDDRRNGYWYHVDCLPGIVSKEFQLSAGPQSYVGVATYYAEGVMERVAEVRGLSMDGYWGGIATMFCGNIGKKAYLKPSSQGNWQGPYIVLDCSSREGFFYNININQIAVEVDWKTSRRWGMSGGLAGVHVCLTYPDCGPASSLPYWFEQFVEWETPEE